MEKPTLIYQKNADKVMNRIIIPKVFIDKFGRNFYLEMYEDKLIIRPVRKEEK